MRDHLDAVWLDCRHAWRSLRRTPASTALAAAILAIGIAGTTAMFAVVDGVLLRPLPVGDQDRLVVAWKTLPTAGSARYPFGDVEIERLADESRLFEAVAGVTRNGVARSALIDSGGSVYANVALVTGRFFDVLGVAPVVGRRLSAADDRQGAEPVVVISHGFWSRRYGTAATAVGSRVRLGDAAFVIVGVMPAGLDYPAGVDVWRLTRSATTGPFGDAIRREVNLVARMRPGVTIEQAAGELEALGRRLEAGLPAGAMRDLHPVLRPFADVVVGDARVTLIALFVAVWLVLLVAGANVANLMLMRSEARRGEAAMRRALGASLVRLGRQACAESLILAAVAGAGGLLIASSGLAALVRLVPGGLPRAEDVVVDRRVFLFSVAAGAVAALTTALAPTLWIARTDLTTPLRGGGVTGSVVLGGRRLLVVVQVAFAVAVVTGAGLLIRTVLALQAVDPGMAVSRLVLADLYVPAVKYADRDRHSLFLDAAVRELATLPAVSAVTPVNIPPFTDRGWDLPRVTAEGQGDGTDAGLSLNLESVHPTYFDTLEVPIRTGRVFGKADAASSPLVAVVSEDVAERLWPGQDPIGKRLKMGRADSTDAWRTVVGVAAATRYRTLTEPRPTLYLPAAQFQMTATNLVLRTTAPVDVLTPAIAGRMHAIDADVRLMRVAPFAEMLDAPLARPRFNALLLGLFGTAALLLSTLGLYAVMAAHVGQRRREIAVRVALGATTAGIGRMVFAESMRLTALGVGVGVGVAAAGARLLEGMLYGVAPLDPATLVVVALVLASASVLAAYVPVRRAVRIDAAMALRAQ